MTGDRPQLDPGAAAIVRRVSEARPSGATAWDLFVAIIDAWDPAIEPLRPMFFLGREEALARLTDPAMSDEHRAQRAALEALPLAVAVDRALDEAVYMGHALATQAHLLMAEFALAAGLPERALRQWRQLLADHQEHERRETGAPVGWVAYAPPDGYHIASGPERDALIAEMQRLAAERGIEDWEPLESEGDLRYVVGIGQVRRSGDVLLQLTALEVRTTVSVLTWRLSAEAADLEDEPVFTVTDDLGTTYRSDGGSHESSGDAARGELHLTPPIPADASTMTVRLEGFALDPFEARFPGARPRELDEPIVVSIGLPV